MPSSAVIERFVAHVEANRYLEAIEEFYARDATVRENQSMVRQGKQAILDHERQFLGRILRISCRCVRPVLMDDNHVAIRWQFEITLNTGAALKLDEIACQRWDGDEISEEVFYYDPAQLTSASSQA